VKSDFDLTTAVKPSREFVARLRARLQEKLGEEVSLNLKVDPGILGGAIITYKGYYFNFSLKKKLDEYFEKSRGEILKKL